MKLAQVLAEGNPALRDALSDVARQTRLFDSVMKMNQWPFLQQHRHIFTDYYYPCFVHIHHKATHSCGLHTHTPAFIGISAPQGCGKTTLTEVVAHCCREEGVECVALSLDDFYVRGDEQEALAAQYPDNPLLRHRGNGKL